jgi:hypothetical protein
MPTTTTSAHHHLIPLNHHNRGTHQRSMGLWQPRVTRGIDPQPGGKREALCGSHSPASLSPAAPLRSTLTSSPGPDVHTQNCITTENQRSDFCGGSVLRHHAGGDSVVGERTEIQSHNDPPAPPATRLQPTFLHKSACSAVNPHGA